MADTKLVDMTDIGTAGGLADADEMYVVRPGGPTNYKMDGTELITYIDANATFQASDAGLTSIAGLTTLADRMIYTTASDTYAVATLTASGRNLIDDASTTAQRATLGLVIGTDVQTEDAGLTSIAGLTTLADRMIYTTASDTYAVTTFTAAGRALVDDASASAQRTTLGVGTGDSPEFTAVNIGAATDTTLARSGAGDLTVEGNAIYRAGGTDVPVADGGSGRSSSTAYAVICGGTTSTAAHQSIASVGTATHVLTSNGAGALPTFQAVSITSTVNIIGSIGGGTQDIDLDSGRTASGTVDTSATTFTFSNPLATGNEDGFTLYLTNGGSQTVTWPASVDWPGGAAPSLTGAGVDILVFSTIDGGTIWNGALMSGDSS